MMAEIQRLTAENEVLLHRERARVSEREREAELEGSAPGGPTDVAVDIPDVGAGVAHGGLETRHAGNLAEIADDAMDDADAGREVACPPLG
jgi:hypothetical protein